MLRRISPRLMLQTSAVRFCTANQSPGSEAQAKAEQQQQQQAETGSSTDSSGSKPEGEIMEKPKGKGLDPSNDPVWEYARDALTREGRETQIEAVVWDENTSYVPILAQGKKNVYDITTDIPKHVNPLYNWHYTQQREYFDEARNKSSNWRRIKMWTGFLVFMGFCGSLVIILSIWISQPKDIQKMREEILKDAYGRVLELGAGHGQNIGQYPYAVNEIIMMDQSSQLLQQVKYRLPKTTYPKYDIRQGKVENLDKEYPDACFDTVIDMFGLCHYKDPVGVLRQMQRVVKPTGTILLLEHGRSPYPPVNWMLDFFAERHYINTHGCAWNRPIYEYFKEARVQVKEIRNAHYGTTWYLVCYPENIEALKEHLERQDQLAHAA